MLMKNGPTYQPGEGLGAMMPLIGCMTSQIRHHVSRICKDAGYNITPEEADTLMIIRHFDGLPQSKLASILGKDKAAVTRLMNVLVNCGLVGRVQDQKDRRIIRAQITAEGESAFVQIWPELKDLSDQALSGIPVQDLACMRDVFSVINANLKAISEKNATL